MSKSNIFDVSQEGGNLDRQTKPESVTAETRRRQGQRRNDDKAPGSADQTPTSDHVVGCSNGRNPQRTTNENSAEKRRASSPGDPDASSGCIKKAWRPSEKAPSGHQEQTSNQEGKRGRPPKGSAETESTLADTEATSGCVPLGGVLRRKRASPASSKPSSPGANGGEVPSAAAASSHRGKSRKVNSEFAATSTTSSVDQPQSVRDSGKNSAAIAQAQEDGVCVVIGHTSTPGVAVKLRVSPDASTRYMEPVGEGSFPSMLVQKLSGNTLSDTGRKDIQTDLKKFFLVPDPKPNPSLSSRAEGTGPFSRNRRRL